MIACMMVVHMIAEGLLVEIVAVAAVVVIKESKKKEGGERR
jgi:hypothetical protein